MTVDELFDAWERARSGAIPAAFAPLCAPSFHYENPLTSEPLEYPDVLASHALGLAATQRELVVHVLFYAELAEGGLHRLRGFFDAYGAAVQLGIRLRDSGRARVAGFARRRERVVMDCKR